MKTNKQIILLIISAFLVQHVSAGDSSDSTGGRPSSPAGEFPPTTLSQAARDKMTDNDVRLNAAHFQGPTGAQVRGLLFGAADRRDPRSLAAGQRPLPRTVSDSGLPPYQEDDSDEDEGNPTGPERRARLEALFPTKPADNKGQ